MPISGERKKAWMREYRKMVKEGTWQPKERGQIWLPREPKETEPKINVEFVPCVFCHRTLPKTNQKFQFCSKECEMRFYAVQDRLIKEGFQDELPKLVIRGVHYEFPRGHEGLTTYYCLGQFLGSKQPEEISSTDELTES